MHLYLSVDAMIIQIDSREHKKERQRIEAQFDALDIQYYTSKLYVGDYMGLDNPRLIVDRKKDISELYSNVVQGHDRFVKELLRAKDVGIQLVILCEHGDGVENLVDVVWWVNPRRKRYQSYTDPKTGIVKWYKLEGKQRRCVKRPPLDGNELYDRLVTISRKYGVRFEFCNKEETGQRIAMLLGGEDNG